jgi:hypothetical protein
MRDHWEPASRGVVFNGFLQLNSLATRRRSPLPGLLKLVAVFAFEPMTRSEFGAAFIIFPNLVVTSLLRLPAETFLFENRSFRITIQLQKMRLLVSVPTVG